LYLSSEIEPGFLSFLVIVEADLAILILKAGGCYGYPKPLPNGNWQAVSAPTADARPGNNKFGSGSSLHLSIFHRARCRLSFTIFIVEGLREGHVSY
jgi:hypothetical protein